MSDSGPAVLESGRGARRFPLGGLVLAAPVVFAAALLLGPAGAGWPDTASEAGRALLGLRLNRVMDGFLVGAALAASGVVLQVVFRNPLADPYVLGVSSGAGLGAALAILVGWGAASVYALPAAAFAMGLATLAVVFLAAGGGRGSVSLYGLLLSGVIVSATGSSLLMLAVSLAPVEGMHGVLWWMLGSLQMTPEPLLRAGAVVLAAGLLALAALGRSFDALGLGRHAAYHLGIRPGVTVAAGLCVATLLTATAVAMAGIVGFVGLIVPHGARALAGPDHRRLPWVAALLGGLFLVVCDTVGRTALAPREIPVGVVTAVVGGPFFLVLLRRRGRGWVE